MPQELPAKRPEDGFRGAEGGVPAIKRKILLIGSRQAADEGESGEPLKNLILCGFMGSGKTTVGRLLAQRLGLRFADTDELIEEKEGRKITAIFEESGEDYFRAREREVCAELAQKSGLVVAAGGGALTFEENAAALGRTGVIAFLDVSPESVIERLKSDDTRPLLTGDREKSVRALLAARMPAYRRACHFAVNADNNPLQIAKEIIEKYESALKR